MYEYRGVQDVVFLMLYGGVTLLPLLAWLYLLMRRGNAIVAFLLWRVETLQELETEEDET